MVLVQGTSLTNGNNRRVQLIRYDWRQHQERARDMALRLRRNLHRHGANAMRWRSYVNDSFGQDLQTVSARPYSPLDSDEKGLGGCRQRGRPGSPH